MVEENKKQTEKIQEAEKELAKDIAESDSSRLNGLSEAIAMKERGDIGIARVMDMIKRDLE